MPDYKKIIMELHHDQEKAWRANHKLLDIVTRASAPGENGPEVAAVLAAEMNARTPSEKDDKGREQGNKLIHPKHVRKKICYLLAYVATDKELPALVECLGDFYLRESARFALERCTAPGATQALIDALDHVGPDFLQGVIGSLADRGGDAAKAAITEMAGHHEPEVAMTAVESLPCFGDASSDDVIRKACHEGEASHKLRAMKARIRLAEALADHGKTSEAKRIYKAINESDAPAAQKKAVEIGMKKIA